MRKLYLIWLHILSLRFLFESLAFTTYCQITTAHHVAGTCNLQAATCSIAPFDFTDSLRWHFTCFWHLLLTHARNYFVYCRCALWLLGLPFCVCCCYCWYYALFLLLMHMPDAGADRGERARSWWPDICMQRTKLIITPSHRNPPTTYPNASRFPGQNLQHAQLFAQLRLSGLDSQAEALALHVLHTPTFKAHCSWCVFLLPPPATTCPCLLWLITAMAVWPEKCVRWLLPAGQCRHKQQTLNERDVV